MHNLFTDYFSSAQAASSFFRDALPTLISKTFSELQGAFSEDELILMLSSMKDVSVVPGSAGNILKEECDFFVRMNTGALHSFIDVPAFFNKLRRLTSFQALYLELWAQRYWALPDPINIKTYASTLLYRSPSSLN